MAKQLIDFFAHFPFQSISAALAVAAVLLSLVLRAVERMAQSLRVRLLHKRLGAEIFTQQEIRREVRHYIPPDCQNIDPAGGETWRRAVPVRQPAFSKLDDLLASPDFRHTILLADSGMGKTSLLLNYFVKRWRRYAKNGALAIVPLGHPKRNELIERIPNKEHTILLLDAFDEDTGAANNAHDRFADLVILCCDFRHLLITCRTHFFRTDDEIPKETGILRFGPTKSGQEHEFVFYKLYLSPFSDAQVERYIRRRWNFWHFRQRRAARELCQYLGDLTFRPMVLSNIDVLIADRQTYSFKFQVFERIISSWLMRESRYVAPGVLRSFSERLAREVYVRREELSGERLPMAEAEALASRWGMTLTDEQIRTRSLLNRDSEGRVKFAHRSIMEYLYVVSFITSPSEQPEWTDQMASFFADLAIHADLETRELARLANALTPKMVREQVTEAVVHSDYRSLRHLPLGISVTSIADMNHSDFLLIVSGDWGDIIAVSKLAMPKDYVIPEQVMLASDVPLFGGRLYRTAAVSDSMTSMVSRFHNVVFGSPQDLSFRLGDARHIDIMKNTRPGDLHISAEDLYAHVAVRLSPRQQSHTSGG